MKTAASPATREALHDLVDELPRSEWEAAARYLAYLRDMADPVLRAFLEAPIDDEPLTPEEEEAIREGQEEIARGEGIPWEVVRDRLLADTDESR